MQKNKSEKFFATSILAKRPSSHTYRKVNFKVLMKANPFTNLIVYTIHSVWICAYLIKSNYLIGNEHIFLSNFVFNISTKKIFVSNTK